MLWSDVVVRWCVVAVLFGLVALYYSRRYWQRRRRKVMHRELTEIGRLLDRGANVEAALRAGALQERGSRHRGVVLGAAAQLALARMAVGELAEAEADLTAVIKRLGPGRRPRLAIGWSAQRVLARVVATRGRYTEAIGIAERVVQGTIRYWGEDSAAVRHARLRLGSCLIEGGRPEDAVPILTDLLDHALRHNYPENSRLLLGARHGLAQAQLELGLLDEAEAGFRQALAGYEENTTAALGARFSLAKIAAQRGELDEAAEGFTQVLIVLTDTAGPMGPWTLQARFELAEVDARQGNLDSALASHRAVLADRIQVLGPDHPETARSRAAVAKQTS